MTAFEIISLLSSYLLFKFSLKLLAIILPLEHIHKRWALLMKGRILVNESTLYICKRIRKLSTNRASSGAPFFCKVLFSGFLQFNSNFVDVQNNSKYRDWAPLKIQQSSVSLDLCLRKTRSGKSRDYRDVIVFVKLRFQNVFRPHENKKPAFSNSSERFRKAPFSWRISVDADWK